MAVNTTNYGFIKPDDDDFYDIQLENANWDKADEELKKLNSEKVDKVSGKQLSANDYTTAEKTKLAGVAANANNYTHPSTHPAGVTVQDATHRFATDAEKTAWNGKVSASGGDLSNTKISAFTASAAELPVPAAGDTAKVFSGKIKKFFEDIKTWKPNVLMKSMVVNNFTTTVAGMVADARALKTLYDHYAQLNSDLGYHGTCSDCNNTNLLGTYATDEQTQHLPGEDYAYCPLIVKRRHGHDGNITQTLTNVNTGAIASRMYNFFTNSWTPWGIMTLTSDLQLQSITNANDAIPCTSNTSLKYRIYNGSNMPIGGNSTFIIEALGDSATNFAQQAQCVYCSGSIKDNMGRIFTRRYVAEIGWSDWCGLLASSDLKSGFVSVEFASSSAVEKSITFSTPMPTADYAICITPQNSNGDIEANTYPPIIITKRPDEFTFKAIRNKQGTAAFTWIAIPYK